MKIEEMDLNRKKMKKTILENGNIVFEELPSTDHNEIGLKYLEIAKQIA